MLFKKVRLFQVTVNKEKFAEKKEGSCGVMAHPCINKLDEEKHEKVKALIIELKDL